MTETTVELRRSFESLHGITAHVNVEAAGEWLGDFYVNFSPHRDNYVDFKSHRGSYVANWDSFNGGNGIFVEDTPNFSMVEEIVDAVQANHPGKEIETVDTGRGDW
jgi:hypothetical protein